MRSTHGVDGTSCGTQGVGGTSVKIFLPGFPRLPTEPQVEIGEGMSFLYSSARDVPSQPGLTRGLFQALMLQGFMTTCFFSSGGLAGEQTRENDGMGFPSYGTIDMKPPLPTKLEPNLKMLSTVPKHHLTHLH